MTFVIIRIDRFLEPEHVVRLHLAGDLDSLVVTIGAVSVHHDFNVWTHRFSHHPDPFHIFVNRRAADLHFDRVCAHLDALLHLLRQLLQALAFLIVTSSDVHRHLVSKAAQQLIHGFAHRPALKVPQSDIYAANHPSCDASPADELGLPHGVPDSLSVERVLAHDKLLKVI